MPNLSSLPVLVLDEIFGGRVKTAVIQAALQISGESAGATPTARSALRQAYAGQLIMGGVNLEAVIWAVGANATILAEYVMANDQAAIPDSDIEYVVASIWDDMSGAARIASS